MELLIKAGAENDWLAMFERVEREPAVLRAWASRSQDPLPDAIMQGDQFRIRLVSEKRAKMFG